ncbi:MAG: adenylate/guanylate cyclase domain-containing protein [Bacteroidota bacterium]
MKVIYSYALAFLLPFLCYSQKEEIQTLESTLAQQNDEGFIKDAISLSKLYYAESLFEMGARRAQDAYLKAKEAGQNELMAVALNSRGKSIEKLADGRKTFFNRAYKSFELSNRHTSDNDLRLDNFTNMQSIAVTMNRPKDAQKAAYHIAVLKGEDPPPLPKEDGIGLFNSKKKKAMEEYRKVQAEKLNLAKEKKSLTEEKASLTEELTEMNIAQEAMREQQETLIDLLETKESAIVSMSEEQMKQELLLSEQERLLDSLTFINILDSLELAQTEMQVEQQNLELREKEAKLQLQATQRNLFLSLAGLFVIAVIGLLHRFLVIKGHNAVLAEKNKIIEKERERSEELLLNILPGAIADELKKSGVAATQHYDTATVMFVDFKGFSKISKQITPAQLVADLDHAFKNFDAIVEKFGLEKIKTIGDAYMCAGGVPNENQGHPINVVKAAIEIQAFLEIWNTEKSSKNEPVFEARIGIHTGPLVAGVVGSKKFAYDIWGDTVNVASRMETSCEPGKVNISNSTFLRIQHDFDCEYRGKVPAKNVGEVEMYYVNMDN